MKNNNENNDCYTISRAMMNCFKQLLFSKNGDINLQGIVDDITCGEENDLLACAVALSFKGIKPKIDKSTRYEYDWRQFQSFEVIDYSMILNTYKCVRQLHRYNKETREFEIDNSATTTSMFPADLIEGLSTIFDPTKVRGIEEK